jgi:hypothetical protein
VLEEPSVLGRWLAVFDKREEAELTEEAEKENATPAGPSASVSVNVANSDAARQIAYLVTTLQSTH